MTENVRQGDWTSDHDLHAFQNHTYKQHRIYSNTRTFKTGWKYLKWNWSKVSREKVYCSKVCSAKVQKLKNQAISKSKKNKNTMEWKTMPSGPGSKLLISIKCCIKMFKVRWGIKNWVWNKICALYSLLPSPILMKRP